ncbi:MAG: four helix bundle protein [Spirosomataceae bacterium]
MNQINSFRDLLVWQKSMVLVTEIYRVTQLFPAQEQYGLTAQMRRCAVSIPSNIAEGYGRNATGDYKRFLQIAVGSLYELQTQMEIAKNLEFLSEGSFTPIYEEAKALDRMLLSLIKKIN